MLRARRRLERGEIDRAIDDFEATLRMTRDFQPRGHLITQLVGVSIESFAEQEILPPILREPGKDTLSIIDISKPDAPKITATIPLINSVQGPPTNLAISPSGEIALVANSVEPVVQ